MARKRTLKERLDYQMSFTIGERWDRFKDRMARFIAWYCLPRRVCMWVCVRGHAALTTGENGSRHPDEVTAFDVQRHYAIDLKVKNSKTAKEDARQKALEFYADPKNYIDTPPFDGDPECFTPKAIPVDHSQDGSPLDCGDIARKALGIH